MRMRITNFTSAISDKWRWRNSIPNHFLFGCPSVNTHLYKKKSNFQIKNLCSVSNSKILNEHLHYSVDFGSILELLLLTCLKASQLIVIAQVNCDFEF